MSVSDAVSPSDRRENQEQDIQDFHDKDVHDGGGVERVDAVMLVQVGVFTEANIDDEPKTDQAEDEGPEQISDDVLASSFFGDPEEASDEQKEVEQHEKRENDGSPKEMALVSIVGIDHEVENASRLDQNGKKTPFQRRLVQEVDGVSV